METLLSNIETPTGDFALWEQELQSSTIEQGLGSAVLDIGGVDFTKLEQELASIDIEKVLVEEFANALTFTNDTRTPDIKEVVARVEFFLAQPEIIRAMDQLNNLARMFSHLCNGADGHGSLSLQAMSPEATAFMQLGGSHTVNDGHNHRVKNVHIIDEKDDDEDEEDD